LLIFFLIFLVTLILFNWGVTLIFWRIIAVRILYLVTGIPPFPMLGVIRESACRSLSL